MAIFNPQLQDQRDPNWLGWSKSITQPEGDKSTGIALSTAADVLGEGLKLADTAYKSVIETEIYDKAKAEQSDYASRLRLADAGIRQAQGLADTTPEGTLLTTTSPSGIKNVAGLKNLTYQVDGLGNARANGVLSETDYDMRLDSMAKDFRARYPGYKQFIDDTFQKVTGRDSANKEITSRLADINSFAGAQNKQFNDAVHLLTRSEVAEDPSGRARSTLQRLLKKEISPAQASDVAMELLGQIGTSKQLQRRADDVKNFKSVQSDYIQSSATYDARTITNNNIQAITVDGPGGMQPFVKLMADYAPGSGKTISDDQWGKYAQVVTANDVQTRAMLQKRYDKPMYASRKDSQGNPIGPEQSATQVMGQPWVNEQIESHMSWHKSVMGAIENKSTGLMHSAATQNAAMVAGVTNRMYKDMPVTLVIAAAHAAGGPNWIQDVVTQGLKNSKIMPLWDNAKWEAIVNNATAQPDLRQLMSPKPIGGKPYTMNQSFEDIKADPNNPKDAPPTPALRQKILEIPKEIINPKIQEDGKIGLVQFSFNDMPQLLSKIDPDSVGRDGRPIKGRLGAFTTITSLPILTEVKAVSDRNPGLKLWDMAKKNISEAYIQRVAHDDIVSLKSITVRPDMKVTWNNERHEFDFQHTPRQGVRDPNKYSPLLEMPIVDYEGARQAKATINRLNEGMRSFVNMHVIDGKDPNTEIIKMFTGMGVKPKGIGLDSMLLDSVINSGRGEMKTIGVQELNYNVEDAPSSGNVAPNGQRGSLSDFLSNPGRGIASKTQNAPAGSVGPKRGTLPKRPVNMSDEPLIGVGTTNVPEGADINQYLRQ